LRCRGILAPSMQQHDWYKYSLLTEVATGRCCHHGPLLVRRTWCRLAEVFLAKTREYLRIPQVFGCLGAKICGPGANPASLAPRHPDTCGMRKYSVQGSRWIFGTGSFLSQIIGSTESPHMNVMPTHRSTLWKENS